MTRAKTEKNQRSTSVGVNMIRVMEDAEEFSLEWQEDTWDPKESRWCCKADGREYFGRTWQGALELAAKHEWAGDRTTSALNLSS